MMDNINYWLGKMDFAYFFQLYSVNCRIFKPDQKWMLFL